MNSSPSRARCIIVSALLHCALLAASAADVQSDPLPSWIDTPTKKAITDFVAKVTKEGSPDFVPPAERIAVFDNDGTLWCEQPAYFQLLFAIDRIKATADKHPEWKDKEPFKSVLAGDMKALAATGDKGLLEIIAATHSGMTPEEFSSIVKDWLKTARHPKFKRPYNRCVYQPMLEVLSYLRANGFKTFIVSGGGVEFMRAFAQETYGIPPEQVVGSSGVVTFEMKDGKPVLTKTAKIEFIEASPSASTASSAAVQSWRSAIPMATCKCCNTPLAGPARDSHSSCITPTLNASSRTTAHRTSANLTTRSMKPRPRAGRSPT